MFCILKNTYYISFRIFEKYTPSSLYFSKINPHLGYLMFIFYNSCLENIMTIMIMI